MKVCVLAVRSRCSLYKCLGNCETVGHRAGCGVTDSSGEAVIFRLKGQYSHLPPTLSAERMLQTRGAVFSLAPDTCMLLVLRRIGVASFQLQDLKLPTYVAALFSPTTILIGDTMNAAPDGSLVPLFDRLNGEPLSSGNVRMLDAAGLQRSLRKDLIRVFNVRNGLTINQFLEGTPTSLHYGLPDTLGLSPQSANDLRCWERVVLRAIRLYEPRLSQVSVQVSADGAAPMVARINIGAAVALGRQLCQVHFDVVLDGQAARLDAVA